MDLFHEISSTSKNPSIYQYILPPFKKKDCHPIVYLNNQMRAPDTGEQVLDQINIIKNIDSQDIIVILER